MPSLRKRVSSYFRQLSFYNEPKDRRPNINDNTFVIKYLEGLVTLRSGPRIIHGKNPTDLPNYELGCYTSGHDSIIGCYSGPSGGLTTVKRSEKHLSVLETDIDFIDNPDDEPVQQPSPIVPSQRVEGKPLDNTTMVIKVAGQEYCVTNRAKSHSKSHSLGSISDFHIEIEKTRIDSAYFDQKLVNNNSVNINSSKVNEDCSKEKNEIENDEGLCKTVADKNTGNLSTRLQNASDLTRTHIVNVEIQKYTKVTSQKNEKPQPRKSESKSAGTVCTNQKRSSTTKSSILRDRNDPSRNKVHIKQTDGSKGKPGKPVQTNFALAKSRSEGNPFHKEKKGKIVKVDYRTNIKETSCDDAVESFYMDDTCLPDKWNRKTDLIYGLSDSLYDRNQVSKIKNGDPIADCFGIIARNDSAILAVADGVNWGEKASVAAKSAVHGCLYYLNKTIFNDTKLFDDLTVRDDNCESQANFKETTGNPISNTREVFVSLLRAFTCAHDLILENNGMLTTLTVAVVLPLKAKCSGEETNRQQLCVNDSIINSESQYVCCVCNVGDTLAYVYSQESGIRELTKGSHDITSNRDMRDALGALGPVDGINPDLSNLTISLTTIQKGDIVMIASDGLTDNFDPNVCRFATNCSSFQSKIEKNQNIKSNKSQSRQKNLEPSESKSEADKHSSRVPDLPHQISKHSLPQSSLKTASSDASQQQGLHKQSDGCISSVQPQQESKSVRLDVDCDLKQPNIEIPKADVEIDPHISPLIQQFMIDNAVDRSRDNAADRSHYNAADRSYDNPVDRSQKTTFKDKKLQPSVQSHMSKTGNIPYQLNKTSSSSRTNVPGGTSDRSSKGIKNSESRKNVSERSDSNTVGYKFARSKTSVDISYLNKKQILRDPDGIPYVTPLQRYELQLLFIEDILKHGISGKERPCKTARKLCESLVSFTFSITSAKRHTLEDSELYFDNCNGVLVEVSSQQKKVRRKRALEKVQNLPGKLDHVTVVAYNVGNTAF